MTRYKTPKEPLNGNGQHVNEVQLAEMLNLSRRTLQGWRRKGEGPAFEKFGRSVRYASGTIEAWIATRERASTTACSPPALCNIPQCSSTLDFNQGEIS